jgi:predicted ester cyclase
MGIATGATVTNKAAYGAFLDSFAGGDLEKIRAAGGRIFAPDARVEASHPVNATPPGTGYIDDVIAPVHAAFGGLRRHTDVMIGGQYQGGEWVTSMGYFCGDFQAPLFGIPASGKLAFLRFGEFHRMEQGRIVEGYVFLGLAELIIALGLWPFAQSWGYEGVVPGPSTHDGIVPGLTEDEQSRAAADLVEDMLMRLTSDDEAWRPYWAKDMVWYGPGALGSYATLEGFARFQRPFEQIFEGWGDGQNEGITGVASNCKAGDGTYVFLCGWPQLTGVQIKPFLGLPATGKRVFMRDCDWWRVENGKIAENWCMLDIPHVLAQLGHDLFAGGVFQTFDRGAQVPPIPASEGA